METEDRGSGFFGRMFGARRPKNEPAKAPDTEPLFTAAHTKDGAAVIVARDDWARMLPDMFDRVWTNPGALYATIIDAVQHGFAAQCVAAARRLVEIDPNPERGVVVLAIVLTRTGGLDEAERALEAHMRDHGRSGVVLNNLAKVIEQRGDSARAEELLWEAVVADPNLDNSLQWWGSIQRERKGEVGWLAAMERIAALPRSWRATLWLARRELETGQAERALERYEAAMAHAATDADALMQVSGDLGMHGRVEDAVRIVRPHYRPNEHGPAIGTNLAQAYVQMRRRADAIEILDALDRLERYDWKPRIDQIRAQAEQLL